MISTSCQVCVPSRERYIYIWPRWPAAAAADQQQRLRTGGQISRVWGRFPLSSVGDGTNNEPAFRREEIAAKKKTRHDVCTCMCVSAGMYDTCARSLQHFIHPRSSGQRISKLTTSRPNQLDVSLCHGPEKISPRPEQIKSWKKCRYSFTQKNNRVVRSQLDFENLSVDFDTPE